MKKLCWMVMAVVLILGLVFTGCAKPAPPASTPTPTTEKPIELKFAHQNPPTGRTTVKFLNVWEKMVEDATNGRVQITQYPAESLCKQSEQISATKAGIADITWSGVGVFPGVFPLSEGITFPFLNLSSGKVDGRTLSGGAINSRIIQELYEKFPEIQKEWADFKLLFLHSSDPFFIGTTKKPVRNMEDIKGLKLRSVGGPQTELLKLLGATPVAIGVPDMYDAAAKGVIDGGLTQWAHMTTYKMYEVYDYWTDAPIICLSFFVAMNLDKWNSLPPNIQKAIMSVSGIYGAEFGGDAGWGSDVKAEVLAAAQKASKKLEGVSLDAGQLEKWKQIAGKPLWDKWVAGMNAKGLPGQKVLDETLRLTEKYRIK